MVKQTLAAVAFLTCYTSSAAALDFVCAKARDESYWVSLIKQGFVAEQLASAIRECESGDDIASVRINENPDADGRREYWGALVLGQSVSSTQRVIYPYDAYYVVWNAASAKGAAERALEGCRENSHHYCGRDIDGNNMTFTFSSDADWRSGKHYDGRCMTVWVWSSPALSGLNKVGWSPGKELPEYFRDKRLEEHNVYCNKR